jgi:shikimate kinase
MTANIEMSSSIPGIVLSRPIVLVGLMGAGKTNIGKRLATELGLPFCDSDEVIEDIAGMDIATIFELYGEEKFRSIESREIANLMAAPPQVIATGGGAFIQNDTRQTIIDNSLSIWLKAKPETLVGRISNFDSRPLLKDKDPITTLTEILALRAPFYQMADLIVDTDELSLTAAIEKVKTAIIFHLNTFSHDGPAL